MLHAWLQTLVVGAILSHPTPIEIDNSLLGEVQRITTGVPFALQASWSRRSGLVNVTKSPGSGMATSGLTWSRKSQAYTHAQPSCWRLMASFHTFVIWPILSPSNCMT